MRLLNYVTLLPAVAWASPLATRQTTPAQIVSVSASGPGCAAGTFTTDLAPDGQAITVGFDAYDTSVNPSSSANREKFCDLTVTIRFPVACTAIGLATTYHGFAQVDSGVTGRFSSSYSISPGILSGGNPPTTLFTSAQYGGDGAVFTKQDVTSGVVAVQSANQRNVSFVVRSRVALIAATSANSGLAEVEDATIAITQQRKC